MALARLALKHLQQRVASASSSSLVERRVVGGALQKEGVRGFASEKGKSEGTEVGVSEGKRSRLFPRRNRRRWLWRNRDRDTFPPALNGTSSVFSPSPSPSVLLLPFSAFCVSPFM